MVQICLFSIRMKAHFRRSLDRFLDFYSDLPIVSNENLWFLKFMSFPCMYVLMVFLILIIILFFPSNGNHKSEQRQRQIIPKTELTMHFYYFSSTIHFIVCVVYIHIRPTAVWPTESFSVKRLWEEFVELIRMPTNRRKFVGRVIVYKLIKFLFAKFYTVI